MSALSPSQTAAQTSLGNFSFVGTSTAGQGDRAREATETCMYGCIVFVSSSNLYILYYQCQLSLKDRLLLDCKERVHQQAERDSEEQLKQVHHRSLCCFNDIDFFLLVTSLSSSMFETLFLFLSRLWIQRNYVSSGQIWLEEISSFNRRELSYSNISCYHHRQLVFPL